MWQVRLGMISSCPRAVVLLQLVIFGQSTLIRRHLVGLFDALVETGPRHRSVQENKIDSIFDTT